MRSGRKQVVGLQIDPSWPGSSFLAQRRDRPPRASAPGFAEALQGPRAAANRAKGRREQAVKSPDSITGLRGQQRSIRTRNGYLFGQISEATPARAGRGTGCPLAASTISVIARWRQHLQASVGAC